MFIFALLLIFFLNYSPILASDRNIFGLHLTQTGDIDSATPIINSSNGDWGWATIVIRTDQLNYDIWQEFFDKCRRYHIIPIVRLATIVEKDHWKKPEYSDIDNLVNFLHSLNWPSRDQHVILFNEINHGGEWGGTVDIKSYTDIAIYTASKFKSLNQNFVILGSAIDLASPDNPSEYNSATTVYRNIFLYKPEYFDNIDGLASHSYPNHGFVGTPKDNGQHSILGYKWELDYLKTLGISKTYPVFITETGWPHRQGLTMDNRFYTAKTTANFLIEALSIWSNDNKVKAVTPFIYNYPNAPFDHFSWLDSNETLYEDYLPILSLPKNKNNPSQTTKIEIINNWLPFLLFTGKEYTGRITLKNTGQSIWGETKFCLDSESTQNVTLENICTGDNYIHPNQTKTFTYKITIADSTDKNDKTFISWTNLPPLEITPLYGSSKIYSPKTTVKQKIIQIFQSFFI